MSTTDSAKLGGAEPQASTAAEDIEVVRVHVPQRSAMSEYRAIKIVWKREMVRFVNDRMRIITSLVQPFLFLFVLGGGLNRLASAGTHGISLNTFIFPGVLCMTVMFTAMFSAMSIVWDREFGFLREMMVAPVRRSSIVVGKAFGGATVATLQGLVVLALAWAVHIPYSLGLVAGVIGIQMLLAFAITSFGVMVAIRIKQMQSFMGVMQMVVMPMYFISGAMFPANGLPTWLTVLNRIDPMAYAVDPMKKLVFGNLHMSAAAQHALNPGVSWWGWKMPALLEVALILVLGLIMLSVAIWEFAASE